MAEISKIQWCDSTVNFWSGCTKVSPGCLNCYAEARDQRMLQESVIHWGKGAPRLKHSGAEKAALTMNRKPWICDSCGEASATPHENSDGFCIHCNSPEPFFHRRRIFSLSLGDWLDDEVPVQWLAQMLDTIRQCNQVIWILCTKRPNLWEQRMRAVLVHLQCTVPRDSAGYPDSRLWHFLNAWVPWNGINRHAPPENICLLTSVENKDQEQRIFDLLKIPARWHGLSMEPLLDAPDLTLITDKNSFPGAASFDVLRGRMIHHDDDDKWTAFSKLDWLIVGGESGPNARECPVENIRSVVRQGKAAHVATFVKQLGAFPTIEMDDPNPFPSNVVIKEWGEKLTPYLSNKKGGNPDEWPQDLRVQQFPPGL